MLMQRAVEAERADKAAAEARAARLAAHNVLLWAALPPGTDIPDMPAEGDNCGNRFYLFQLRIACASA